MPLVPLSNSSTELLPSTHETIDQTPEEIKAEITSTRERMDEHLSQLGGKLKPKVKPAFILIPLAGIMVGIGAYFAYRKFRPRSQYEKWNDR